MCDRDSINMSEKKQCNICKKYVTNYSRHMNIHTRRQTHKCKFCGKSFTRPDNLHNHVKRHVKKTYFVCNICDSIFSEQHNLNLHKEKRHPNALVTKNTIEKPYDTDVMVANPREKNQELNTSEDESESLMYELVPTSENVFRLKITRKHLDRSVKPEYLKVTSDQSSVQNFYEDNTAQNTKSSNQTNKKKVKKSRRRRKSEYETTEEEEDFMSDESDYTPWKNIAVSSNRMTTRSSTKQFKTPVIEEVFCQNQGDAWKRIFGEYDKNTIAVETNKDETIDLTMDFDDAFNSDVCNNSAAAANSSINKQHYGSKSPKRIKIKNEHETDSGFCVYEGPSLKKIVKLPRSMSNLKNVQNTSEEKQNSEEFEKTSRTEIKQEQHINQDNEDSCIIIDDDDDETDKKDILRNNILQSFDIDSTVNNEGCSRDLQLHDELTRNDKLNHQFYNKDHTTSDKDLVRDQESWRFSPIDYSMYENTTTVQKIDAAKNPEQKDNETKNNYGLNQSRITMNGTSRITSNSTQYDCHGTNIKLNENNISHERFSENPRYSNPNIEGRERIENFSLIRDQSKPFYNNKINMSKSPQEYIQLGLGSSNDGFQNTSVKKLWEPEKRTSENISKYGTITNNLEYNHSSRNKSSISKNQNNRTTIDAYFKKQPPSYSGDRARGNSANKTVSMICTTFLPSSKTSNNHEKIKDIKGTDKICLQNQNIQEVQTSNINDKITRQAVANLSSYGGTQSSVYKTPVNDQEQAIQPQNTSGFSSVIRYAMNQKEQDNVTKKQVQKGRTEYKQRSLLDSGDLNSTSVAKNRTTSLHSLIMDLVTNAVNQDDFRGKNRRCNNRNTINYYPQENIINKQVQEQQSTDEIYNYNRCYNYNTSTQSGTNVESNCNIATRNQTNPFISNDIFNQNNINNDNQNFECGRTNVVPDIYKQRDNLGYRIDNFESTFKPFVPHFSANLPGNNNPYRWTSSNNAVHHLKEHTEVVPQVNPPESVYWQPKMYQDIQQRQEQNLHNATTNYENQLTNRNFVISNQEYSMENVSNNCFDNQPFNSENSSFISNPCNSTMHQPNANTNFNDYQNITEHQLYEINRFYSYDPKTGQPEFELETNFTQEPINLAVEHGGRF